MSTAEWLSLLSTLAATAAATFAGIELHRSWRDRNAERRGHRDGVAVAWHPLERPNRPEPSGEATWVYEITVQNPGPLPIRDVVASLAFVTPVHRLHYDGVADPPARTLTMREPVILGLRGRIWKRSLIVRFDDRHLLEQTTATVTFTPAEGSRQTNHMDGSSPTLHRSA